MRNGKELAGKCQLLKRQVEKCKKLKVRKEGQSTPVRRYSVIVPITAQTRGWKSRRYRLSLRKVGLGLPMLDFEKIRLEPEKLKFLGREKCGNIRPGVRVSCHSRDCTSVSHQERNALFSQRPLDISRTTEGFINFRRWRYSSFRVAGADTRYRRVRHAMYWDLYLPRRISRSRGVTTSHS